MLFRELQKAGHTPRQRAPHHVRFGNCSDDEDEDDRDGEKKKKKKKKKKRRRRRKVRVRLKIIRNRKCR